MFFHRQELAATNVQRQCPSQAGKRNRQRRAYNRMQVHMMFLLRAQV